MIFCNYLNNKLFSIEYEELLLAPFIMLVGKGNFIYCIVLFWEADSCWELVYCGTVL